MPESSTASVSLRTWVRAARPKTLGAAVAPVLVGTAMALEAGQAHAPAALTALACALLIQIGTNFSNDYLDYEKGADAETRKGPLRVTQAGLAMPRAMRRATVGVFGLAFVLGLYLVWRGGWPVLAVGVASIGAGVWYTAGCYSLAYLGLADGAVLLFFGPVAVAGTYYVQALAVTPAAVIAGLAPGLLAVGILLVNNIRDVEEDRAAGKRTLVVRRGRRFGVRLYAACIAGAALVPGVLYAVTGAHPWVLLASAVALPAIRPLRTLRATTDPSRLNPLLAATGRLLLLYSVLFAIGWNV